MTRVVSEIVSQLASIDRYEAVSSRCDLNSDS